MANLTKHARKRAGQRSIPEAAIDLLLDYGDVQHLKGVDGYFFNTPAKRRLRDEIGSDAYRRIERHLRIFAIVSDNSSVVTVAWRRRRLFRR